MLLKRELEDALMELNEHLEPGECEQAIKTLETVFVGDSLLQTNEAKYEMLRLGIPICRTLPGGKTRTLRAQVFDFDHPEANSFVATEELWVYGPYSRLHWHSEGAAAGAEGGAAGGGAAAGVEGGARIAGGAGAGTSAVPCAPSPINENARFDISSIDFGRLSQEFAKAKHKHLIIDDLRGVIEARLDAAMKDNPLRIDFYKRYEKIIEGYNAEQDRAVIEKTFNDLMRLSSELDEKQKEWVRQGFQNQQQMTVFELLFKETLSPAEIKQVKAVAIDLVAEIDERLGQMVRWTEKEETVSQVKVIIRNAVYQLPEASYPDAALPGCIDQIFDYFYTRDAAA